jgi:hypothetical protein
MAGHWPAFPEPAAIIAMKAAPKTSTRTSTTTMIAMKAPTMSTNWTTPCHSSAWPKRT